MANKNTPPGDLDKTQKIQKDIDDVKQTMNNNINVMIQNHDKLDALQDKTDNLRSNANAFSKRSTALKRTMWWKDKKLCLLIAAVIVIIIIILIIIFVPKTNSN